MYIGLVLVKGEESKMGRVKELFTCMNCTSLLATPEEWNCGFCLTCFHESLKSFERFSSDFDDMLENYSVCEK